MLLFLDVETTGKEKEDRLCQVAFKTPTSRAFCDLFKPPVPISLGAMSVNHITEKMVANEPIFLDSATFKTIESLFKNDYIMVAHNAAFDSSFLLKEGLMPKRTICTMKLAHKIDTEGKFEKYNLSYLRYYFGIEIEATAHDALGDVLVLEEVFNILEKSFTIQEMLEISLQPIMLKRMPFGKYKGMKFEGIPQDYLLWLQRQVDLEENMRYTLEFHISNNNLIKQ